MTGVSEIRAKDAASDSELLQGVYAELRRIAAAKLAREMPGQTLQATALVHEAWLRLGGEQQPAWDSQSHFIAAAAEAMRRILVENARKKLSQKRRGEFERVELHESAFAGPSTTEDEKLIQVNEALEAFAAEDPEKAEVVKLRFFVGLTHEEIAALLEVNEKTVRRHWEVAKVRLFEKLSASE